MRGLGVGIGQWREGFTQVPVQVLGEHADQDVGADAVGTVVVDGAQVQVVGFDVAEVAFNVGEVFVGGDGGCGVKCGGGNAGADDVDAVEGGFGGNRVLVAFIGEAGVGDHPGEVFGHLVLVDHFAEGDADGGGGAQAPDPGPGGDGG